MNIRVEDLPRILQSQITQNTLLYISNNGNPFSAGVIDIASQVSGVTGSYVVNSQLNATSGILSIQTINTGQNLISLITAFSGELKNFVNWNNRTLNNNWISDNIAVSNIINNINGINIKNNGNSGITIQDNGGSGISIGGGILSSPFPLSPNNFVNIYDAGGGINLIGADSSYISVNPLNGDSLDIIGATGNTMLIKQPQGNISFSASNFVFSGTISGKNILLSGLQVATVNDLQNSGLTFIFLTTGVSGALNNTGTILNNRINLLSGFVSSLSVTNTVYVTGNQLVSGVKTFISNIQVSGSGIISSNTNPRIVLSQSQLLDNSNNPSLDWNNRYLVDSTNNQAISWSLRTLSDSISISSIDWGNRGLNDNSTITSLNWQSRTTADNGGNFSFDWQNRYLYDIGGVVCCDWNNKILKDSFDNISTDWNNRYLADGNGTFSVNWNNRTLLDNTLTSTLDWNNKTLIGSNWNIQEVIISNLDNNPSIDTNGRFLFDVGGLHVAVDWRNRALYDSIQGNSIDWQNRFMYDNLGNRTIDWQNKNLNTGVSNLTVIDWGNLILSGNWNSNNLHLSGNLVATVNNLQTTGQNSYNLITGLSGVLNATGSNLFNNINGLSGIVNSTISNLQTTGQSLYNLITGIDNNIIEGTKVIKSSKINFKSTGIQNLYTVPNSYLFNIDTMEVICSDLNSLTGAPYVMFGYSGNISGYQTTFQTNANYLYARDIRATASDSITGGVILNATIYSGAIGFSQSGFLIVRGYLIKNQ